MRLVLCAMAALLCLACVPGRAVADQTDECAALEMLYPQPGRTGQAGENAFRPLPVLAPVRPQVGEAGTLSLSIGVDHVSPAKAGAPGMLYVGNYAVTDLPAFHLTRGAATTFQVIRPEDGKTLPMSDACFSGASWDYGGTQWSLVQGDTLDVLMHSRLDYSGTNAVAAPLNGSVPCDATNLHTHGLLVSPYHPAKAGLGSYGDYVLDATLPRGNPDWGLSYDTCDDALGDVEHHHHGLTSMPLHYVTQIPGQPGVNSLASGEHPSGLFWYHPHPHGHSKLQVDGGTTGAITVGALTDYACPDGDGVPGNCMITNANIRMMALKSEEIQPDGQSGLWKTLINPESGYCSDTGGVRQGECQAVGAGAPGKWVFTVNGVQYPAIHPGAGRMEIWRMVNTTSNVSFVLSLTGAGKQGAALPFQVLSRDGVSIQQGSQPPATATQLLMMPSSRVEIAIPAPPGGGTFILHNQFVATGLHGSGDDWPSVDLASIVWDKGDGRVAARAAAAVHVSGPAVPAANATATIDQKGLPAACRFAAGDTRVVYFVHRFVPIRDEPKGRTEATEREIFGLIAGIRHADGTMDFHNADDRKDVLHSVTDVWTAGTKARDGADASFPAFMHNPWSPICTFKGSVEPWELQNWTGEDHNFHLHQSKFSIDPNGVFEYPVPEPDYGPAILLGDQIIRQFADPQTPSYHDNVPVPRGQSFCHEDPTQPGCKKQGKTDNLECTGEPGAVRCANPGKMSIVADFSRAEQVGTFVYHCHILEHEDAGMMATINVVCPPGDSSCSQVTLAKAPICRPAVDR